MYFRLFSFLLFCFIFNGCATKKNLRNANKPTSTNYSAKLGCQIPVNSNKVFIDAISEWVGVPYSYGGNNMNGTDCSGFVQAIYKKVFNKNVEHNSHLLSKRATVIKYDNLEQGDLLFFKINKKQIDHVGMHIFDTYFIHASTKKGVIVSDLEQPYYQNTFAFYGRLN
jgi:probable lipoprotein NlpC